MATATERNAKFVREVEGAAHRSAGTRDTTMHQGTMVHLGRSASLDEDVVDSVGVDAVGDVAAVGVDAEIITTARRERERRLNLPEKKVDKVKTLKKARPAYRKRERTGITSEEDRHA